MIQQLAERRCAMREVSYSFPEATLNPGAEVCVSVHLDGKPFRLQKLVMTGDWDVIRGFYRIKHSRLPPLDAADATAHAQIHRWDNGRQAGYRPSKVTIAYAGRGRHFVRKYLPTSVVYVPVNPVDHVVLTQTLCGQENSLPASSSGIRASWFDSAVLGNSICAPVTRSALSLWLKNFADVQIRMRVAAFGVELA